jgi:hypothetical protein
VRRLCDNGWHRRWRNLRRLKGLDRLERGRRSTRWFVLLFGRALRRLLRRDQQGREKEDEAEENEEVVTQKQACENDDSGEREELGVRLASEKRGSPEY